MSAKKFKFVSPGVFLNEIDNSILPKEPREIGPLVIGRAVRGPANRPVTVDSFEEFVNVYGAPHPGGDGTDVWRNGNKLTPTYGAYAAQAWLKNSSTLTFFRLAGNEHLNNDSTDDAKAGWRTKKLLTFSEASAHYDVMVATDALHHTASAEGSMTGGGAYGLWVFDGDITGSAGDGTEHQRKDTTGSLAAIWYIDQGSMGLSGLSTFQASLGGTKGYARKTYAQAEPIASDSNGNFTAVITGSGVKEEVTFNFDKNSDRFARKVFNTNPTVTNLESYIVASGSQKIYWLGETYENTFTNQVSTTCDTALQGGDMTNTYWGVILALATDSDDGGVDELHHSQRKRAFTDPETGWYFSQDLTSATGSFDPRDMQKLFKFVSLGHGEWAQNNIKISIQNLKVPSNQYVKYGTFDVVVRNIADSDKAQQIIEKFGRCNLDPKSADFVGNKIGTQYYTFDTAKRRLILKGAYPNRSKYIRVELDPAVEGASANEEYLPFGVYGPTKYRDFMTISGTRGQSQMQDMTSSVSDSTAYAQLEASNYIMAIGGSSLRIDGDSTNTRQYLEDFDGAMFITSSHQDLRWKFTFPRARLRQHTGQDNLPSVAQANFGIWTGQSDSSTVFNRGIVDLVKPPASGISEIHDPSTTAFYLDHQYVFTLDDIKYSSGSKRYEYDEGCRRGTSGLGAEAYAAGTSVSAVDGGYTEVLNTGISAFTTLLYGGCDGWDIKEPNPIRNTFHDGTTETTNYAYNTIKQAVDSVKDPEFVEYNLISAPGITNNSLTSHLIDIAEDRADTLAIIDLEGDFEPAHEGSNATAGTVTYGDVSTTVNNLKNRGINNSYACAYYPFVQCRDTLTGDLVYMPPSVLALGAMSYTDRVKAPWFAPAGFNRGGLSSGIAGLPVMGVTDRLTSEDRDSLYDANINPIASFPSEGIVIFGQKTLQVTRSALDRINVRRLLLFVKKGISRISNEMLFEPNVQETWDRFISRANPFLADVKARFGLTEYKLILDKTTTTPDLIDQNIMYAKVFLKPARAIEFIAVDFIITNTGASFED